MSTTVSTTVSSTVSSTGTTVDSDQRDRDERGLAAWHTSTLDWVGSQSPLQLPQGHCYASRDEALLIALARYICLVLTLY